jgi:hypothetical protein
LLLLVVLLFFLLFMMSVLLRWSSLLPASSLVHVQLSFPPIQLELLFSLLFFSPESFFSLLLLPQRELRKLCPRTPQKSPMMTLYRKKYQVGNQCRLDAVVGRNVNTASDRHHQSYLQFESPDKCLQMEGD